MSAPTIPEDFTVTVPEHNGVAGGVFRVRCLGGEVEVAGTDLAGGVRWNPCTDVEVRRLAWVGVCDALYRRTAILALFGEVAGIVERAPRVEPAARSVGGA